MVPCSYEIQNRTQVPSRNSSTWWPNCGLHTDDSQVSDRGGSGAPWQHLAMTREGPPLLFAGGIDGSVALFDLRQHDVQAAARVHLHDGPMASF